MINFDITQPYVIQVGPIRHRFQPRIHNVSRIEHAVYGLRPQQVLQNSLIMCLPRKGFMLNMLWDELAFDEEFKGHPGILDGHVVHNWRLCLDRWIFRVCSDWKSNTAFEYDVSSVIQLLRRSASHFNRDVSRA